METSPICAKIGQIVVFLWLIFLRVPQSRLFLAVFSMEKGGVRPVDSALSFTDRCLAGGCVFAKEDLSLEKMEKEKIEKKRTEFSGL